MLTMSRTTPRGIEHSRSHVVEGCDASSARIRTALLMAHELANQSLANPTLVSCRALD